MNVMILFWIPIICSVTLACAVEQYCDSPYGSLSIKAKAAKYQVQ